MLLNRSFFVLIQAHYVRQMFRWQVPVDKGLGLISIGFLKIVEIGGAGPLHAARLARELDISRIIVPPAPGALCALGLLVTDLKADFSQTRRISLSPDAVSEVSDIYDVLADRATRWLDRESVPTERRMLIRTADMRYMGQNHELQVPVPAGPIAVGSIDRVADNFEAAHRQRFGFAVEGESIEFVTLRIEALGHVDKTEPSRAPVREHAGSPDPRDRRNVWLPEPGGPVECPVYSRSDLLPGQTIPGPAIVEQMDTTTLVLPEMLVQVDEWQNLIMEPA